MGQNRAERIPDQAVVAEEKLSFLKMSVLCQACGTGTLTRGLFLILSCCACFSMSWENADLALRMQVLGFIAVNGN